MDAQRESQISTRILLFHTLYISRGLNSKSNPLIPYKVESVKRKRVGYVWYFHQVGTEINYNSKYYANEGLLYRWQAGMKIHNSIL